MEVDAVGGTLIIKDTQKTDAGGYRCVAVNAAGTSSGLISLDVGGEMINQWIYFVLTSGSESESKPVFFYFKTKLD